MKGLIFKEFLDFVELTMSYEMVDKIIMKSNLETGGAYTCIGTYDYHELLRLITALSEETNIPVDKLILKYGEYMFGIFLTHYPQFFTEDTSTFQFLSRVETHIHTEVKKLYVDAELPHFECSIISPDEFIMIYTSSRPLADLAEGLIRGCINYHKENIEIIREDIPIEHGSKTKFALTRR